MHAYMYILKTKIFITYMLFNNSYIWANILYHCKFIFTLKFFFYFLDNIILEQLMLTSYMIVIHLYN